MPTILLTKTSTAADCKHVLLSIITAAIYVRTYADDKEMTDGPLKKIKKRGINNLKAAIKEYNTNHPEKRGTGGSTYVGELLDIKGLPSLKELCRCTSDITDPVSVGLYERIMGHLSGSVTASLPDETRKAAAIDYINGFAYCQELVNEKFLKINRFHLELIGTRPKAQYTSTDDFLISGDGLKRCNIRFDGDPLLPTAKPTLTTETDALTETPEQPSPIAETETPVQKVDAQIGAQPSESPERCLAHHLNFERQIVLADTALTWEGTRLIRVVMEQREEFRKGAGKNTFVGEASHIINEERTIYIVLKAAHNPSIQMQVTMERTADEFEQRNGVFSYMKYKDGDQHTPAVPFSGLVVLQTVPEKLNIEQFEQELKRVSNSTPDRLVLKQVMLRDALRIRYRILDQVATFPKSLAKADTTSWISLQDCVGQYVCYYMRLSNVPAKFEMSQIQIFADGRATLRQPPGDPFEGYVRVNGNRLWIYFRPSYDEVTGKEPIRFMVDKVMANGRRIFRGMFSSQTMTEKKLVSGRMLMKLLLPKEKWPKPFSIDFNQVNLTHLPDAEDRKFFMEEWKSDTNLTDGPIWAEVSNRLQKRSAISILTQLCTDDTLNKVPFNRNQFYYYSFKNDSDDEDLFFIQRDLLTFHQNGTVTIDAGGILYEGYTYHHQKTLRLSLTNAEHGFLEIFLSVLADKSDPSSIGIIYGQSLWRSGSRIQGKNIVLSRPERGKLKEKQENFYFLNPTDKRFKYEIKRITDEDVRGSGVMSYQRGEMNRFTHTTANASHGQFRPRDQRFREMHFLIACCYGFQYKLEWPMLIDESTDAYYQWLKSCQKHLKEAFTHGYACDFAGISLRLDGDVPPYIDVENIYHDKFPAARRNNSKTEDIINRIRQIAAEQRFLRKAFAAGGPLAFPELYDYAGHYWPLLLPGQKTGAMQTPPQTRPTPSDNPAPGPDG